MVLAALILFSAVGYLPAAGAAPTGPPPSGEVFTANNNISVWDRAILPLRTDTSNAAMTVPNADWSVRDSNGKETSLNDGGTDPVGVYDKGTQITVDFDLSKTDGSSSSFKNTNVQLVAAHLEESGDFTTPNTVADVLDLLNESYANSNASFEEVGWDQLDGVNGDASFTYTPSKSGAYVFFLARNESGKSGFVIDGNGNFTTDGTVTILGLEQALVRSGDPSVAPRSSSVTRGKNVVFDADASGQLGANAKHLIVVYDESTYTDSRFVINLTDSVSRDFDIANNSTLEHSISDVNGVARADDSFSMLDITVNDSKVSRTVGVPAILDFISEKSGADTPQSTVIGSGETLDASSTAVNATSSETLTVETFANWSTGTYRWAYIAVGGSSSDVVTDTGTIKIVKPTKPKDDTKTTSDETTIDTRRITVPEGEIVDTTITNGKAGTTATIKNLGSDKELASEGFSVDQLDVSFSQDSDFRIRFASNPDKDTIGPDSSVIGRFRAPKLGTISIYHPQSNSVLSSVTFTFRVSKDKLEAEGIEPSEVVLYRIHDGKPNALETKVIGETADAYKFKVVSPGLSVFVISSQDAVVPVFSVTQASLAADQIDVGDEAGVQVTVENTGNGEGVFTAELAVDGDVVETKGLYLEAGRSRTMTITHQFDEAGTYELAVNGTSAGTLTVGAQAESTPTETATEPEPTPASTPAPDSDGGLGLSAIALVAILAIALIGGALYFLRQRGDL